MAIKNCKITDAGMNENGMVAAPDTLRGSAQENKALFDRLVKQVVALQFNTLLDELLASTAAGELGMEPVEGLAAGTVQEGFRLTAEALAQRICKVEGSVKGRLPVLQEDGALQDGGVLLADVLLRLVSAKVGNIPAFDSTGKLKDSGVSVAELLKVGSAAEESAEAAARSAEIAREIATGDVVSQTELQEAVENLAGKDPFILTYGDEDRDIFDKAVEAGKAGRPVILHRWNNGKLHQSSLSMSDYTSTKDVLIFREPMESGTSTNCRFIRDNNDGSVYWTMETKAPTPAEHTHAPASIGAAVTQTCTVTVPVSWTADTTNGGYYQKLRVYDVSSLDNPIVDLVLTSDVEANKLQMESWEKVDRVCTTPGVYSLTLYAYGDAPAVSFKIQVKVVR